MKLASLGLLASVATASNVETVDIKSYADAAGITSKDSVIESSKKMLAYLTEYSVSYLSDNPGVASEYPYFNFIPMPRANIVAGNAAVSWSGKCFSENSAVSVDNKDGSQKITITTSGTPASEDCYDFYWFMTVTGIQSVIVDEPGVLTVDWTLPADASDSEVFDLGYKGVRVMEFLTGRAESVANLLETVLMFIPEFTQGVDPKSAQRNVDFMAKYPQVIMEQRDPLSSVPPPEKMVHSGDFFGVIRLDGLDPMLAWAMGSTTGHTTVALWIDGELYICESTVTDSYWPTNGIQKTPYKTWLKQAEQAGYNVVHAPLSAVSRARFNETAAIEFFTANEGFDYGYITMFWGWIDTLTDNYPCIPSDYSSICLTWEVIEPLFGMIDRAVPQISDLMWNPAWNKRLGTTDLGTADLYQEANKQGMATNIIPTIVEQDDWVYETTRYGEPAEGKAMVCCVFVCNIWKAAGLFGDMEVNCGELTNYDDYALNILDGESAEQIIGRWTLTLNDMNTRKPYPHMAEKCESLAPDYYHSPHC